MAKVARAAGIFLLAAGLCSSASTEAKKRDFTPQQRRWWAIQKVAAPAVPAAPAWLAGGGAIDRFLAQKLAEKGLRFNDRAGKTTLIRRVTLDLTGLPPSPEEVQAFLADSSPDAYAKVVDRLLASPRYGERWARHWLDLARYADSEGFKSDETRPNVWRYRDYVIDSFNQDKPYDRFVKEQIAGDELYPEDPAALVATGFNRHFPDESNARNLMQRRQELLNDITDTVGATFLGLTYACARCHDHKFDPILQKDYYRLQAFFANTRIEDQAPLTPREQRAVYQQAYSAWDAQTREIRERMATLAKPMLAKMYQENFDKFPSEIQDAITTAAEKKTPIQWQMYYKARPQIEFTVEEAGKKLKGEEGKQWKELSAELSRFDSIKPADAPIAQAMIDNGSASPKTHVLQNGVYDAPVEEVEPGLLSILDPAPAKITPPLGVNSTGRRAALANLLTSPDNPLTARVMVNRVWHYHFGRGLSGTPSDFGMMGERPVNRELLDYLTANFVRDGWSIKKLHRQILLTEAYQQSSANREEAVAVDPENKLLWRFSRRRLEGEAIRDSMLMTSGKLNLKMHGPGVFPPLPPGVVTRGGWKTSEDAAESSRRSVYVFVRRNMRYPMFEAFDMPDTHESCARRHNTLIAPQALELLNNEVVLDWARAMAGRVLNDGGISPEAQVDRAYRLAFTRLPSAAERAAGVEFLNRQASILSARLANQEKPAMPEAAPADLPAPRAGALVDLCHMLLNSNEFVYLN